MKWWWPIWGEVPAAAEPAEDEPEPEGLEALEPEARPLGLVHTKGGNKHVPTKHTVFPNRMNRNKRMP